MRRVIKPPKQLWARKQPAKKGSPEAALHIAEGITGEDRFARSAAVLDQALRQWPDNAPLLRARAARSRDHREFEHARSLLLKASQIDGGEAQTLEGLGLLYMAWNRLDEAEAALLAARGKAPRNPSVLVALAGLYQHLAKRLTARPRKGGRPRSTNSE